MDGWTDTTTEGWDDWEDDDQEDMESYLRHYRTWNAQYMDDSDE